MTATHVDQAEQAATQAETELAQLEESYRDGKDVDPGRIASAQQEARGLRRVAELARDRAARKAEQQRQQEAGQTVDQVAADLAELAAHDDVLADKARQASALMAEMHQLAHQRRERFHQAVRTLSAVERGDTPAAGRVEIARAGFDRAAGVVTVDGARYTQVSPGVAAAACVDPDALREVLNTPGFNVRYASDWIANARKAVGIDG